MTPRTTELESQKSPPLVVAFVFAQITNLHTSQEIQNFLLKALDSALKKYNLCNKANLQGQFVQNSKSSFQLEVQGSQKEILEFSDSLQHYIPLSLQWAFKELLILKSFSQAHCIKPKEDSISNFLTPLELQLLGDKESSLFCDLWADWIDFKPTKLTLLNAGQRVEIRDSKALINSLERIATLLKSGERVFVKTIFGKYELLLLDENNPPNQEELANDFYFMPNSLANVKLLFRAENEELQALATLEKPILNLAPKGIFEKFFSNSVQVILPFEPYLVLLSKFLESNMGLYLLPLSQKRDDGICEFVSQDSQPLTLSVAQNSLLLPHCFQTYQPNSVANAFRQTIAEESLQRVNVCYIGREQTLFWVYFDGSFKEALDFSFQSNLGAILETLKTLNQTTQSLLKNFSEKHPLLIQSLESLPKDSILSHNLLDLLGMCGVLLGLGEASNLKKSAIILIECAQKFLGKKGPRIDFRLVRNDENKIILDTLQTLRSVMSFKLAEVENELLCFGILDSLAEFFANFSRDMEENYQTKGIVICGELFLNTQFTNQFLHYLPKTSEVYPCQTMEFTN